MKETAMKNNRRYRRTAVGSMLVLIVAVAGCGDDETTTGTGASRASDVTVTSGVVSEDFSGGVDGAVESDYLRPASAAVPANVN
jgi:hypothetical protein